LKQKEAEDVIGEDQFKNADSIDGKSFSRCFFFSFAGIRFARLVLMIMPVQCPNEACNGERAYFFQLQIRSADEPMTTFLRVGFLLFVSGYVLTIHIVHYLRPPLERLVQFFEKTVRLLMSA
jgi:Transcription factor S-II (TFIIS)